MKNLSALFITLLFTSLIFWACPKDEPPAQNRDTTIHLTELSTGLFHTSLKISVEDTSDSWIFELTRDDSTILVAEVFNKDTTIQDQSLINATQYTYRAYWLIESERADSSETVTILTGDTTSHNFIWEIDTLGNYGSYLNDVAIVNENDIWVVGNIETDSATYNAAHWDGNEWEMIKIQPQGYVQPLGSIYYFSNDNIWFSLSTLPIHWNGESYYLYTPANDNYPGGSIINAIWASSPDDIYFVGSGGGIVHYDGSVFTKMESGTDVVLLDIAGTPDGEHIFAVGWDAHIPAPGIVLEFTDGEWNTLYYTEGSLPHDGNVGWVWGLDVINDFAYFPTSVGLWKYNFTNQDSILIPISISHMNRSAFTSVNINSTNDIFLQVQD